MNSTMPLSWLSDAQLQERIEQFARLLLDEADKRYQQTGSVADRAERDLAWISQRAALKERGRRRRIVDDMERRSGLA